MARKSEFTNLVVVTGYLVWARRETDNKTQGLLYLPSAEEARFSVNVPFACWGKKAEHMLDLPSAGDNIGAEQGDGTLLTLEGRVGGSSAGAYIIVERVRVLDEETA